MNQKLSDAAVVGAGAATGAVARFVVTAFFPAAMWPLLVVNVVGALAMGYFHPGLFWGIVESILGLVFHNISHTVPQLTLSPSFSISPH